MKWTKPVPKIGDKRTRKVFLWLPESIFKDNERTWYWLQNVKVTEEYQDAYEELDRREWVLVSMEEVE